MLKLKLNESLQPSCGAVFFVLPKNFENSKSFENAKQLLPDAMALLTHHKFTGAEDQVCHIVHKLDGVLTKLFFVGAGDLEKYKHISDFTKYRNALGVIVDQIKKYQIRSSCVELINFVPQFIDEENFLHESFVALLMAQYEFNVFKDARNKKEDSLLELNIVSRSINSEKQSAILKKAEIIAEAINMVRGLGDLPANIANPSFICEKAKDVAKKYNLEFKSFGKDKMKELGMGGVLAVGSGSVNEPQFFEIKFTSKNPGAKTIAVIGKGVTFDTGGVSLKPSNYMNGMKYDMSGAASTIGIAQIVAQLNPNVNVVCIAPLVENMPSGSAYRQDDIVTHMNGITTEVNNTDAEGRLILADAICYAEKFYKPNIIIDIATLTGACVVALGHFFTGMFTNDQTIADELKKIGDHAGDFVWQLPCDDNFDKGIESSVADISNTGKSSFSGGASTAACFLRRFVDQASWVHLDIAGTEADMPIKSYLGKTATGASVRLISRFILEYF